MRDGVAFALIVASTLESRGLAVSAPGGVVEDPLPGVVAPHDATW